MLSSAIPNDALDRPQVNTWCSCGSTAPARGHDPLGVAARRSSRARSGLLPVGIRRMLEVELIHAELGHKDEAFLAWLEKAHKEHGWAVSLLSRPPAPHEFLGAFDDMVIGQHVAVFGDDDAGTESPLASGLRRDALEASTEELVEERIVGQRELLARGLCDPFGPHGHHGRRHPAGEIGIGNAGGGWQGSVRRAHWSHDRTTGVREGRRHSTRRRPGESRIPQMAQGRRSVSDTIDRSPTYAGNLA